MSLFCIKGNLQSAIGKRDYWQFFRQFEGSQQHRLLVSEILPVLDESKTINSSHLGKKILTSLSSSCPESFQIDSQEQLGSLFGMTLWNELSKDSRRWSFITNSKDQSKALGGVTYFPGG
jgi:hypothetical protein